MWNGALLRARRTQVAHSQMSAQIGQLRELVNCESACTMDEERKNTYEPDTGASPEEQRIRSAGTCDVPRIRGVCGAVYWIRKEKACGRSSLQRA